jgi:hypothetical protein
MAGYTRQSTADILPGQNVAAGPLNDEFNTLEAAFAAVSGHAHDGTTGSGPKISLTASVSGILPEANGGTGLSSLTSFVTLTGTQTLTNKTLTTPTLTTPTINGAALSGTFSGAHTVTGLITSSTGNSTTLNSFFLAQPTNWSTNNPRFSIDKTITANKWNLSLFDGVNNNGTINFVSSALTFNDVAIPTISSTSTLTNKTLTSPVINTPTGIVKGDVGLGNVDNTSDATKNAASVTLTNKTLTSPTINAGALSGTFSGTPTFSGNVVFSGAPTVTTPAGGDNTTKITNTAWVLAEIAAATGGLGAVTLTGAQTITGLKTISIGTATTFAGYLLLQPTDYAVGKPRLGFNKNATATQWDIGLYDGVNTAGTINFDAATALTWNGVQIVTTTGTQTLTNKTLTSPAISSPTISGTVTASTLTVQGTSVIHGPSTAVNSGFELGQQIGGSSTSTFLDFHTGSTVVDYDSRIIASGGTGSIAGGTLDISAATFTFNSVPVVTTTGTQTLTNKTLTSPTINAGALSGTFTGAATRSGLTTVSINTAVTQQEYLQLRPTDFAVGKPYLTFQKATTATTWNISLFDGVDNTGTINLVATTLLWNSVPVVGTTSTQTLTNKTLTSPTINSGTLASGALSGTFSGAPTLSGNVVFSGAPVSTTPSVGDDSTKIATTAFVQAATSYVKIGSATGSGVSQLAITNIPTSGYSKFILILDDVNSSNVALAISSELQYSTDNGSTWKTTSGDYTSHTNSNLISAQTIAIPASSSTFIHQNAEVWMYGLGNSARSTMTTMASSWYAQSNTDTTLVSYLNTEANSSYRKTLEAENALRIVPSSGNISGTITLYGIKA